MTLLSPHTLKELFADADDTGMQKKDLHPSEDVWIQNKFISLSLSLFLSISLFLFNEIDVEAWEYERTPKYAPGHKMANDKRSKKKKKQKKTEVGLTVVKFA